ncbi:aminomethyl-transferring glycine dehydrogenase subunit GcvPB, partial [bacterium]|nr:aminomethyl-transferring glycine dehydrogenase subunit GcvPB [bacterium]
MRDLKLKEETLFERSRQGRCGYSLPKEKLADASSFIPQELLRKELDLPELSEVDIARHYTRLSTYNFSIDLGFYPLGSCTMKYNPKINEKMARIPAFANLHPETPVEYSQGTLKLMYEMQKMLSEIGGFAATTLNPSAGAHGEYVGLGIIRSYFKKKGDTKRKKIIIPDSAHGTNPASCTLNGFDVVVLESNESGKVCVDCLKGMLNDEVAGIMLTNPNTLGVFESDIMEITKVVHDAGGLVYGDGANMNAILGIARPGDMGIDVLHYNLHKTFSTPHGGGGPGSGPVGVCEKLAEFLPDPHVVLKDGRFSFANSASSMGMIRSFYGNMAITLRAYVYILEYGKDYIADIAKNAVLNANYIKACLKDYYHLKYKSDTLHEVVFDDSEMPNHVTTMDIAKALIDRGYHPPTVYFPLIVHGAIMIEPTETESKETLDSFIEAMIDIFET